MTCRIMISTRVYGRQDGCVAGIIKHLNPVLSMVHSGKIVLLVMDRSSGKGHGNGLRDGDGDGDGDGDLPLILAIYPTSEALLPLSSGSTSILLDIELSSCHDECEGYLCC